MPSTHTSLHYHVVFSTKHRLEILKPDVRARIHEYLGGCVRGLGGTPLQVGGVEDHVHLLFGLKATCAVADVVREIKKASTSWIRESFDPGFQWQEGYGAFAVSRRDLEGIVAYIKGQDEHHRARTFQEEYAVLLHEHGIVFDARYLW